MSVPDASHFTNLVHATATVKGKCVNTGPKPHNTFAALQYSGKKVLYANKRVPNPPAPIQELTAEEYKQALAAASLNVPAEQVGTVERLAGVIPGALFTNGVDASIVATFFSVVKIAQNALIDVSKFLPLQAGQVLVFPIRAGVSVDLIDGIDQNTRTTLATDGTNTFVSGVPPNTNYTGGTSISPGQSYTVGRFTLKLYGNGSSAVSDGSLYSNPARIDYEENASTVNDQLERFQRADIINAGHSAADLFEAGFTIQEVKTAVPPYGVEDLLYSGYSISDLRIAGLSLTDILGTEERPELIGEATEYYTAGFTASELRASESFVDSAIQTAGYSIRDLRIAGYTVPELRGVLSPTLSQLRLGGYSVSDIAGEDTSFNAMDFYTAGFSLASIRDSFDYSLIGVGLELLYGGVSARMIRQASIPLTRQNILIDIPASGRNVPSLITPSEMALSVLLLNIPEYISLGYVLTDLVDLRPLNLTQYPSYKSQFAAANFTLSDLIAAGFSLPYLRSSSYTAKELKALDYSASQLKNAGYILIELNDAEYSFSDLRQAGYTVTELMRYEDNTVQTAQALRLAGYTASDLRNSVPYFTVQALRLGGYTLSEIQSGGYTLSEIGRYQFTASQLKDVGYTAEQLAIAGFTALELRNAEYNDEEILGLGFSVGSLGAAGYSIQQIFNNTPVDSFLQVYNASQIAGAGIGTNQLVARGISRFALKQAGYSAMQVWNAGFTDPPIRNTDLKDMGYSIADLDSARFDKDFILLAGYTATQLRDGGYTVTDLLSSGLTYTGSQLRDAGYTLSDLTTTRSDDEMNRVLLSGYTAKELRSIGYTLADLRSNGLTYTLSQLRDAEYTASELYYAGYRAVELKAAGYTFEELMYVSPYGVYEIIRIAQYIDSQGIIIRPWNPTPITLYNIKSIVSNDASEVRYWFPMSAKEFHIAGFSVFQLKNRAFFSDTEIMNAGYTAKELVEGGFPLSSLKDMFSIQRLLSEGYGVSDLLTTGYTFKDLQNAIIPKHLFEDAGYGVPQLKEKGYAVSALLSGGYSISDIVPTYALSEIHPDDGYRKSDFANAGYTVAQLKEAGTTPLNLRNFGYNPADLRAANYTAEEANTGQFGIYAMLQAGYPSTDGGGWFPFNPPPGGPDDFKRRFTVDSARLTYPRIPISDYRAAGFHVFQVRNDGLFTANDFYTAGYSLAEACQAGFSISELLGTGYITIVPARTTLDSLFAPTQIRLNNAGYSIRDIFSIFTFNFGFQDDLSVRPLKQMGGSIFVAKAYNFTGGMLRTAGYTVEEALSGGYTSLQIFTGGYPITALTMSPRAYELGLFAWIRAGYDAQSLIAAGFE